LSSTGKNRVTASFHLRYAPFPSKLSGTSPLDEFKKHWRGKRTGEQRMLIEELQLAPLPDRLGIAMYISLCRVETGVR
jgi:hypothetical protein